MSLHHAGEPNATDDRERIFEPFSASSRRVGGTALGLSISRTIIEAHGGKIWVEADPTGTKFVFTLPVSATKEDVTQPIEIEQPRRRGLGDNACALIVDDDPSIRMICREVLELGGYQVRDAGSANAALAEARRFRPDMIVLDVLMPGIDGYRTAEMIRADPAIGMAPIMFLSARGDTADKVRAFRSGAEDYMVKPFDAAELLARVAKALDRQARELGASPTTQLPGADAIQAEVERRIGDPSAVACYLDLDNLKSFNDYYGYAKTNAVIRQTGDVIRYVVQRCGDVGDFIGHIAGDDFVFMTSALKADTVCRAICDRFDHLIRLYYDPRDRERGYIETKDRFGIHRKFPIMSVSA